MFIVNLCWLWVEIMGGSVQGFVGEGVVGSVERQKVS